MKVLCSGEFFGGAVQQPDVRVGADDDFAVQLQNQPQNPVRRRMLRAEVHRVVAYFRHAQSSSRAKSGSRTMRGVSSRGGMETGW